jgi:hypothetical protein
MVSLIGYFPPQAYFLFQDHPELFQSKGDWSNHQAFQLE